MNPTVFWLLVASNCILLVLCGYLLYLLRDKLSEIHFERNLREDAVSKISEELGMSRKANHHLRQLLEYKDATPSDCKEGRWCGACEFGRLMMVYSDYGSEDAYYYCTKAQCCDYWAERKTCE